MMLGFLSMAKKLFPSTCIKYLGVLLDSDLSWKSQINNIAIKLKRANGALAKLRHFVPQNILTNVYYAIFHSHLQYCSQIWGQPISNAINRISVLQKCAVRLMSFAAQRTHSDPFFANLGVLKFSDMVHCHNVLFLHKVFHNIRPASIHTTYAIDFTHAYKTRGSNIGLYNLPIFNSISFGKNSIRYQSLLSYIGPNIDGNIKEPLPNLFLRYNPWK